MKKQPDAEHREFSPGFAGSSAKQWRSHPLKERDDREGKHIECEQHNDNPEEAIGINGYPFPADPHLRHRGNRNGEIDHDHDEDTQEERDRAKEHLDPLQGAPGVLQPTEFEFGQTDDDCPDHREKPRRVERVSPAAKRTHREEEEHAETCHRHPVHRIRSRASLCYPSIDSPPNPNSSWRSALV